MLLNLRRKRCGRALWRRLRLKRQVDRDPFSRGRIIDVRRAAAREFDMIAGWRNSRRWA
jgi:hypothetical protein